MYKPDHIQAPLAPPSGAADISAPVTVRDVMARVRDVPHLSDRRKGQIESALRTACRVIGAQPGDVIASPHVLRARLESAPWALAGLKKPRWYAIRSLTLTALRLAGFKVMSGRRTQEPLSDPWYALRDQLPDVPSRRALLSFHDLLLGGKD